MTLIIYALWFFLVTLVADAHAGPVFAVIGAISAAVAKGGIVALLIKGALSVALSLASSLLQKALAKKQQPPGVKLEVEMGDDLPVSTTIGTYATSGKRKYIGTHGAAGKTPNAYLVDVIELGNLPVSGLNGLWIDDEEGEILWAEAHADYGAPIKNFRKNGVDFAWVRFHDGTQTTADAYLRAKFGTDEDRPWKDTMIGRGCPYAVMTYRFNQNLYSGLPQVVFEPGPIRLYDISKDSTAGGSGTQRWNSPATWQPSDNLMVLAYNVIRGLYYNGTWFFGGRNLAAHRLPASAWIAAVTECARLVGTYNGATEPQFRAGYEITGDMEPLAVLEDLRDAGAARIAEVGGSFKPAIGAFGAAVYAFTDDDIVVTKGQSYEPFPFLDDTYNPTWPTVAYTDVKQAWTRLSGIMTVPAGKTRMALLLQVNKDATGGPNTEWSKPVLRRAAAAELIVDGAVIASKIQSGAVVTDKLQVGAATIDKLAPNAATQVVNRYNTGEYTYTTTGDKLTGESAVNITMGSGDAALIRGAVRVRQSVAGTTDLSLKLYVNGNLVDEDFTTLTVVGRRVYLSVDYLSTTPGAKEVNLIMTISSITGECKRSRYFLSVINFRKGILLV